ncbi:hypothetical protein G7K_4806-t1 [Saitoella complicata NRRL Y-17804]|uniref:Uncharacterized protein n=1 Tax=Saitoella complicata (strain BCRC 22490 / CBS 7301 / JCM 7358 / NBRC 10748 / NRRL Y-17804) TaxID=698492 RepID=A0A0E9NLF9_SAICN|nr:hypothetical protein G7K_4806-t1 [Saitoella complicata NRRL Y-17804]
MRRRPLQAPSTPTHHCRYPKLASFDSRRKSHSRKFVQSPNMTTFVASLFLPHTISFDLNDAKGEDNSLPTPANSLPVPNLLVTLGSAVPSPPATPGVDAPTTEFFFPSIGATLTPAQSANPPSEGGRPGMKRMLTQPRSRASSPPPPNIALGKAATLEGIPKPFTHQMRRRRQSSVDETTLFATANWTVEPSDLGNGGLKNAIRAGEEEGKLSNRVWVGTLGMPTDALQEETKKSVEVLMQKNQGCLPVWVKDSDFEGTYDHFCKQIIWPMFHYQIPDEPKSKVYEDQSWKHYVALNQAFADAIIAQYKKGDTIWVNDYHLLLVPGMIRKAIPDAIIGFFLHVSFPSSEVFRCFAVREQLLRGMLGCTVIAFQTSEYARHFLQTCSRLLRLEASSEGVYLDDRFVSVKSVPLGIDPGALQMKREEKEVQDWVKLLRERYEGKRILVGRDKFDHVRGVKQKLLAYEMFLANYPEFRDNTVLIQVATSTTENRDLQTQVTDIVTRINSTYANLTHTPVIFLHQDITFSQYLAMLTIADALIVTSLREGMNLTCHEYVFCQSQTKHPLVLSEFTGSADGFGKDAAILCNPWDYKGTAKAIHNALTMSKEEMECRWEKLNEWVLTHTAVGWVATFRKHLEAAYVEATSSGASSIPRLLIEPHIKRYHQSRNGRFFFVDYEGTTGTWGDPRNSVITSPQVLIDALNELVADPLNVVYLTSAHGPEDLEALMRRVPKLGLVAENGCYVRPFGRALSTPEAERLHPKPGQDHKDWVRLAKEDDFAWHGAVKQIFEYYAERTPGARVTEKNSGFIFDYSNAEDNSLAARQAGEIINHVNDACAGQTVHAVPGEGVVVAEPTTVSKAKAAEYCWSLLDGRKMDFLCVAGDDRTDEDVFRWANELEKTGAVESVLSVSIGERSTQARSWVPGTNGMVSSLESLLSG